jgi:branched-chain amino acid transport system permease protein
VIIGGAGSLWGACLGAALVVAVRDAIGPSLGGHGTLVLGLAFILVVYLLPRGAAGLRLPTARRSRRP